MMSGQSYARAAPVAVISIWKAPPAAPVLGTGTPRAEHRAVNRTCTWQGLPLPLPLLDGILQEQPLAGSSSSAQGMEYPQFSLLDGILQEQPLAGSSSSAQGMEYPQFSLLDGILQEQPLAGSSSSAQGMEYPQFSLLDSILQEQPLAGSSPSAQDTEFPLLWAGRGPGLISSHPSSTAQQFPEDPCAGPRQPEEPAHPTPQPATPLLTA
ncbi:hypothetical protein DUI87_23337 [Hirundo rustica rustica]|uniref:Uncharacterized protein n=1 Tax=Hirundo rustica rustica TaxID=333673 RepID=A0A3M0JMI1_HIRRU|nr:hypothetical protein DUI87_23337 [Hirundo rustica rustica]